MVRRAVLAVVIGAEALAAFLPWLETGQRRRNVFELIDAAETLGVLESGWQRVLAAAYYLVPLLAVLCWLALLLERHRAAAGISAGTGALGFIVSLSIERASVTSLIGARLTLVFAFLAVVGGLFELLQAKGGRKNELAYEPG